MSIVIPAHGFIGGLAGGLVVALGLTLLEIIEGGLRAGEIWFVATMFGLIAGLIVGGAMGVVASLLRLLAVGLKTGVRGQMVAVSIGALGTPFAFMAVLGFALQGVLIMLVIGALAAFHFCRVIIKRAKQDAAVANPA